MKFRFALIIVFGLLACAVQAQVAPKGIDVRASGSRVVFRTYLTDTNSNILTTGTANLRLYELQQDGTIKSYDFNDNTFKTTALTTETVSMTHRTGNNSTTNTGLWTYALTTVTGFTRGGVYFVRTDHSSASPSEQLREFQYGEAQGDFTVDSSGRVLLQPTQTGVVIPTVTTLTNAPSDSSGVTTLLTRVPNTLPAFPTNFSSLSIDGSGRVDIAKWLGTAPATLTTNGYLQTLVAKWLTDNAGGTPNALTSGRVETLVGAVTAGTIAADVWNATAATYNTATTMGAAMNAAGGGGDPFTLSTTTAYGANTFGKLFKDNVDAAVSTRMATFTLPTNFSSMLINGSGQVRLDLSQPLDTSIVGDFVGGGLLFARASYGGKITVSGSQMKVYAADGTTIIRTFTLTPVPVSQTRQ
jgi:hypothetical protein